MMLLGAALLAVSLAGSRDELTASATTISTEPAVVPEGLAPGTTAPVLGGRLGVGVAPRRLGRAPLRGFGEVQVEVTSGTGRVCQVCLLSALTPEQRARGLMEVTDEDLGGYDGMLFEYPDPIAGAFWMRNTPMPLSIAYFDGDGVLVSTTDMAPCGDSADCPTYPADDPFRFALEVPRGRLSDVGVVGTASIRILGRTCPLAAN